MYAIIATGGKQYKVAEGDVIKVERLGAAAGEAVTFDQVLAVNNGEMKIGCPTVESLLPQIHRIAQILCCNAITISYNTNSVISVIFIQQFRIMRSENKRFRT